MNELRKVGKIVYEFEGKQKTEYFWRDNIDNQLYVNDRDLDYIDFPIPKPTGFYLLNLPDNFDITAVLTNVVVSPGNRENGYTEYCLYYSIEELGLSGIGSSQIGMNHDGGSPVKEIFLSANTILKEELHNGTK
ncbi:hypothetical protein P3U62_08135 [Mammaliicoccus vitulinus]|uniref:hypothetical protein n=1 Tax=Mammaliicoccus vitulinus TaxID=71237 RepID=UPI002B263F9A|nr:hypothetical protein [Mammaliicoccus vitulinus]WQK87019.1 hypothetical protein P3U62_08135 [Mammaliicoccus vitulinus]